MHAVDEMLPATLGKIRSEDLRAEALHADAHPRTVIVEVDLPLPQVGMIRSERFGASPTRFSVEPSVKSSRAPEFELSEIKRALTDALGRQPGKFLASSRAFIIDATGKELGRLAAIPSVLAIWPNTRR